MLLVLLMLFPIANGYIFSCLPYCTCDTVSEVISCGNRNLTKLELPPDNQQLRGFDVVVFHNTGIVNLPTEKTLLEKIPNLKLVKLLGNRDFNCSTLSDYNDVKLHSDCVVISETVRYSGNIAEDFKNAFNDITTGEVERQFEMIKETFNSPEMAAVVEVFKDIMKGVGAVVSTIGAFIAVWKSFGQE